jgi:endonuclease/exonuclease/phosphatase family metal-dependent hydrolase
MARRDDTKAWKHLLEELGADLALLQETTPPPVAGEHGAFVQARAYPNHSWGSVIFVRDGQLQELSLPEAHHGFLVAAEVTLPGVEPLVAVSVHAKIVEGYVRPNLDEAFEALYPLFEGRSYIVGGDFNLSRNYDRAYGTKHHSEFLDDVLPGRGFINAHRKFHREEEQTFWGPQSKIAYQDDHVYVSPDLADAVVRCDVVPRAGFEDLSDHSALMLEVGA